MIHDKKNEQENEPQSTNTKRKYEKPVLIVLDLTEKSGGKLIESTRESTAYPPGSFGS